MGMPDLSPLVAPDSKALLIFIESKLAHQNVLLYVDQITLEELINLGAEIMIAQLKLTS